MTNDELLVEEYKLVQNYLLEGEKIFLQWENVFLLINGALFGLSVQALLLAPPQLSLLFISGYLGLLASVAWFVLMSRTYVYIRIREKRLKNIEDLLRRQIPPDGYAFALFKETEDFFRDQKLGIWQKISAFRLRTFFPIFVILFWVIYTSTFILMNLNTH